MVRLPGDSPCCFEFAKNLRCSRHSGDGKTHGPHPNFDRSPNVFERRQCFSEDDAISSYKLIIAYEGTRYYGWQNNKNHPTIQGEIQKACRALFQEEISVEAASRTDRGVHAKGQVVQIVTTRELPEFKILGGLNAHLPFDIRVLHVEQTDPAFHVTLDSVGKTYLYHIDTGPGRNPFHQKFSWHYPYPLNLELMRKAAQEMVGERFFAGFTTKQTDGCIRRLDHMLVHEREPYFIQIEMRGDRFLYNMARTLAGTLAAIGAGKLDPAVLPLLFLEGKRALAGMTAPAAGLTLQSVHYPKNLLHAKMSP